MRHLNLINYILFNYTLSVKCTLEGIGMFKLLLGFQCCVCLCRSGRHHFRDLERGCEMFQLWSGRVKEYGGSGKTLQKNK
jgi:hypothetical protein